MANCRILLLMSVLSICVRIKNCEIDSSLKILHEAGEIPFTVNVVYNPENISVHDTVLQLKNITEQVNQRRFKMNEDSYASVQQVFQVLTKKYGALKTIKKFSFHKDRIHSLYKEFVNFVRSVNVSTNVEVIDDFFIKILNSTDEIIDTLKHITHLSINDQSISTDWFLLIDQYIRNFQGGVCDKGRLTQGHILNYYFIVFDMEFRASFLLITAYRHLTRRRIENHHHNIKKTLRNAEMRLLDYSKKASKAIKNAQTEIFNCDDGRYVKNRTYAELSGITQGFLIDPTVIKDTETCELHKPEDDVCALNSVLCFHRKCSELGGKVNNCRDITEGKPNVENLTICPADDFGKQYSWLEIDGTPFGNHLGDRKCSKQMIKYGMVGEERESFFFIPWTKKVEKKMCFCDCERAKWRPGDVRMVSLVPSKADYENNRVITDVKFRVTNGIIQLRAQQGLLLPGGRIDQSTLSWIDTPDAVPVENGDKNAPQYTYQTAGGVTEFYSDDDFEYVSKDLTINLDDNLASDGYVVVAVDLQRTPIDNSDSHALELEICSMKCDFASGTLYPESVEYVSDIITRRKFLDLGSPGNPVHMKNNLKNRISKPQQSVRFQQTDWKNDLGQSIVPFFDLRPVKPTIALPLTGVGLYHRGCTNCGGYIAMKLFTLDISEYLVNEK